MKETAVMRWARSLGIKSKMFHYSKSEFGTSFGLFFFWCHYSPNYGFWFRVFGWGLTIIDRTMQQQPFSVRSGIIKERRFGKYGVKILRP